MATSEREAWEAWCADPLVEGRETCDAFKAGYRAALEAAAKVAGQWAGHYSVRDKDACIRSIHSAIRALEPEEASDGE